MALMRIKLTNGDTTIDLFAGAIKLMEGGLDIGNPKPDPKYISSPMADGDLLSSIRYGNRTMTLNLKASGTTLTDLKTNIRAIERILTDAKKYSKATYIKHGTLTASGKCTLELQWGDSAGLSTFFEVVQGQLKMPADYYSVLLLNQYKVINCQLILECKPFGQLAAVDIAQATLYNGNNGSVTKYEYYNTGDDNSSIVRNTSWWAQTFTPTLSHQITSVKLFLFRTLSPGTITVSIRNTNTVGKPTGGDLCVGTTDGNTLPTGSPYEWREITFGAGYNLIAGIKYATVVRALTGDGTNYLNWTLDYTSATYTGGNIQSSADSGTSWSTLSSYDFMFEEWGTANYQDISTTEAFGDVPAKMYIKIAPTGATGTKTLWVAKRSGFRQTDNLWKEGEAADSWTLVHALDNEATIVNSSQADAACSAGNYDRVRVTFNGNFSDGIIGYLNFNFATPPRGSFRVLARCKSVEAVHTPYTDLAFGMGYSYGGRTYTPSTAKSEYYYPAANNTYQIFDLGLLNIPPMAESDIANDSIFVLRIYTYLLNYHSTYGEIVDWCLDYIFLLPVDEGVVIVTTGAADIIALDAISERPNIFIIDGSSNITGYPVKLGAPFNLGRESTRIYVLRDDVPAATFALDVKYIPQFSKI